jgi:CubicO group peptidase (beta-lactamase class C family)
MASFVGWHALRNPPGNTWQYSTGDGILLGATLDAAMKPQLGAEWQWPYFFDLVGMNNAVFEQDLAHSTVGGSYFWATPRDMARFGYLYLNGGCWNGQQVLPPGWNTDANKLASGLVANRTVGWTPGSVYGHLWWLNTPLPAPWPTAQQAPPYPDAPPDTYLAVGHWGQFVVVIPSHNMVIIRTGDDRDSSSLDQNNANMDQFLKLALAVGQ